MQSSRKALVWHRIAEEESPTFGAKRFTVAISSPMMAAPTPTACSITRRGLRPFSTFRIPRVAICIPAATSNKVVPANLASILLSAPAWAENSVSQLQAELPSSLPSPEEVAEEGGSVLQLFADNPIIVAGLVFLAAIPVALNFLGGGALGVKQVNATGAIEGLTSDPGTVLIDIRSREEAKQQGSPNLSTTKKRAIVLPFTQLKQGDVEKVADFAEKFSSLKQIKPDSSIIILDSYGQEAPKAAKLLAKLAGRVYYVKDGAVGPSGWKESGQPWREPGKSLLNLDGIAEDFKNQPTLAKAGVAVGAVGVAAAVLFQEAGTVLELAALAAAGAVAVPRFFQNPTADAGDGTQRQQVKQFVESAEKDAAEAAGKVQREVKKVAETELGAKVKANASKAADATQQAAEKPAEAVSTAEKSAEKAAGNAAEKVGEAVSGASDVAEQNAQEAKAWIDDWRKESARS